MRPRASSRTRPFAPGSSRCHRSSTRSSSAIRSRSPPSPRARRPIRPQPTARPSARLTAGRGRPLILTVLEPRGGDARSSPAGTPDGPGSRRGCSARARSSIAGARRLGGRRGARCRRSSRLVPGAAGLIATRRLPRGDRPPSTPGAGGDPRSNGQGPGLVGTPGLAIAGVAVIAVLAIVVTTIYVRATTPRPPPGPDARRGAGSNRRGPGAADSAATAMDSSAPPAGGGPAERAEAACQHSRTCATPLRYFRPIGKNCEIGRLRPSTSHFLHERPCRARFPPRPTDATLSVTKAARAAGRPSEHDPGVERRRAGCATTGSTRAATGATGSAICSDSWPPPRPAPSTAPCRRAGPAGRRAVDPAAAARSRRGRGERPAAMPTADATVATSSRPRVDRPPWAGSAPTPRRSTRRSRGGPGRPRARRPSARRAIYELRGERFVAARGAAPADRLPDLPRSYGALGLARTRAGRAATRARSTATGPARRLRRCAPSGRRRELAVAIPGRAGRGASCSSSATPRRFARPSIRRSLARVAAGARRDRQRRPGAPRRSPTSSIAPRPCAGSPATSAAGSTSTGSWPASSTTRWSCSRATGRPSSCSSPDGPVAAEVSRGLSAAYLASRPRLPGAARCRRPPSPPAGRCSRSTTATTRAARTSAPPSSRRASTRCARRRCSTATSLLGLLNVYHDRPHQWTADELDTMAALATQAERRDPGRPGLRADGDLGRPAPVDPAARRPAEPAVERRRDRPGDRHRAAPADRLPQRPRLPARRATTSSRSRCRARSASTSTRRPTSCAVEGRRGHHRLGRRPPDRPEPAATPRPIRGRTRSRAPRTTSTSRCSSRR